MHDDPFMQIGFSLTHIKGEAWSFFIEKEKIMVPFGLRSRMKESIEYYSK